MTTTIAEEKGGAQDTATAEQPKTTKKASAGARSRQVAPKKGKSGKKASPAKKAPKSAVGQVRETR